jgi:hypothetical protein
MSLRHGSSQSHDSGKAPASLNRRGPLKTASVGIPSVRRKQVKGVGRRSDQLYDPKTGRRRAS